MTGFLEARSLGSLLAHYMESFHLGGKSLVREEVALLSVGKKDCPVHSL